MSALGEDASWRWPVKLYNNVVLLEKSDLSKSLNSIDKLVRDQEHRCGLTHAVYKDEHDEFEMVIQDSTRGYSVSCRLNDRHSHILNTRFFSRSTSIGDVMLIAADALAGMTAKEFFESDHAVQRPRERAC
jgi:hypothetical protein